MKRLAQGELSANYWGQMKNEYSPIGDKAARKIERLLDLPEGWMDTVHDEDAGHRSSATAENY